MGFRKRFDYSTLHERREIRSCSLVNLESPISGPIPIKSISFVVVFAFPTVVIQCLENPVNGLVEIPVGDFKMRESLKAFGYSRRRRTEEFKIHGGRASFFEKICCIRRIIPLFDVVSG